MKRVILISSPNVKIGATIDIDGLTRDEVERLRSALADRLQAAAAGLPYLDTPIHKVRVR